MENEWIQITHDQAERIRMRYDRHRIATASQAHVAQVKFPHCKTWYFFLFDPEQLTLQVGDTVTVLTKGSRHDRTTAHTDYLKTAVVKHIHPADPQHAARDEQLAMIIQQGGPTDDTVATFSNPD